MTIIPTLIELAILATVIVLASFAIIMTAVSLLCMLAWGAYDKRQRRRLL